MDFASELKKIAADVDKTLDEMLPKAKWEGDPADVARYGTIDAGKRLRTFLTVQVGNLFDAPYEQTLRAGAIIETVHNFSLIHDDLPCMDNDRLRRGKPSAWAKFGERNAVLGGDYLFILAFEILSKDTNITSDAETKLELVRALAEASDGMHIGQYMDCEAEAGKRFQSAEDIEEIQRLKTGQIFLVCAKFGMILGHSKASAEQTAAIEKYIAAMGVCFQQTDDILDATGDESKVGKTLRKDGAAGKATYVSLLGIEGARAKAREFADIAKDALNIFDGRADNLRALIDFFLTRES